MGGNQKAYGSTEPALQQQRAAAGGIIGNGTNTQPVHKVLAQIFTAVPVIEIDEKHSTVQARTLYWQLNKPHGWCALLQEGLRVPPEPLDGYAAAVLVKRYLEQNKSRD